MTRVTGKYNKVRVVGEEVEAFIPCPLPPQEPPLQLSTDSTQLLKEAETALSHLDLVSEMLPSLRWFIYSFARKEAVISSQIEGTQATLLDLFKSEIHETQKNADVQEICNYISALDYALTELNRAGGLPISTRLLCQTHWHLMQGARGTNKLPGEIRREQNWIGAQKPMKARYLPPPYQMVAALLSDLEKYIHTEDNLHPLVRAGLLHVQFETIHPFLDGNGRIGRLLITLLIKHWGLLSSPLLYLSLFFKRDRNEYYRRLNSVRLDGDWEGWTHYFLAGIKTIATEAVNSIRKISHLISTDRKRLLATSSCTVTAVSLFEFLPENPVITSTKAMELLQTTRPTATKAITALLDAGILQEIGNRKRNRILVYNAYLDLLKTGTELN